MNKVLSFRTVARIFVKIDVDSQAPSLTNGVKKITYFLIIKKACHMRK
jgi:hypothetical protein